MPKSVRFTVVRLNDKRLLLEVDESGNDSVRYFDTGEAAAETAEQLTKMWGEKWQPRRTVIDTGWLEREAKRFRDGTYHPVPWDSAEWWHGSKMDKEHFAHVSVEQDAKVAFTRDAAEGAADKQQRMNVGRYLQRYCANVLSTETIRNMAAEFSVQYDNLQLNLATDAKKIVDVYMNGPRSCMSHPLDNYLTNNVHPATVYAAGDLAVAYLEGTVPLCEDCEDNGEGCQEPEECRIKGTKYNARCVVWPEKKLFSTIYGDVQRLEGVLRKEGYKKHNFPGAKLLRKPIDKKQETGMKKCFILPFIDNHNVVKDDGEHLILVGDSEGHISCRNTNGLGYDSRPHCADCNELFVNTRVSNSVHNRMATSLISVCNACFEKRGGVVTCNYHRQAFFKNDCVNYGDWGWVSMHAIHYYVVVCSRTFVPMIKNLGDNWVTMADGTIVSSLWFQHSGKTCFTCNQSVPRTRGYNCGNKSCRADETADEFTARRKVEDKATRAAWPKVMLQNAPISASAYSNYTMPPSIRRR